MLTILHHTECSKSRNAIQFLENLGLNFETRLYVENPLNEKEIEELLEMLNLGIHEIIRKNETTWIQKFSSKTYSRNELISILANYPDLLQRPIVIKDRKAVIARPTENIEQLLK